MPSHFSGTQLPKPFESLELPDTEKLLLGRLHK